jgi:hypothetical protein
MKKPKLLLSAEAEHGEKMIEVKIRFWTNNISKTEGKVIRKHAWSSGVVRMEPNKSHGIVPGKPQPFHTLMHMNAVIEKVLIDHGIVLHLSRNHKKYMTE